MKVSFVIPAYNEAKGIGACLEALLAEIERYRAAGGTAQTEVVVVNNNSTDNTKAVAARYPGVRVVDEPIKGLVSARAAGYQATDGDIVANIDADVVLPDGWLGRVVSEFARDPKLVALSGPFLYYDLSALTRALVKIFYGIGYATYLFNQYVLHVGAMLQGGNFVIRRSAFDSVGGFNTAIEFYGEDTDVARRLSHAGRVKWTFALPVYTTGRRLKAEGLVRMSLKYAANYFWMTYLGRPLTKKYRDIRPQ